MFGNLSSNSFTIKTRVGGNLKSQAKFKMKTRSQNKCCVSRRADKSGLRPSVRNQVEAEKYVTEMNSSSEPPNQENSGLGSLDPPSPKNISKAKRIKWTLEEYKEVMTEFYQALTKPKDNTIK